MQSQTIDLVSNISEIVPYLLYILFPVTLALSMVHTLSIDLGTDILPSMGLGQAPPEPDTMQHRSSAGSSSRC